ncbi:MAG: hypothetical protein K6T71_05130 [Candidatus Bipolaricaulota bacterium]|nr:hypothetical protein [Candidatus Bipolaricaulota bacterium]
MMQARAILVVIVFVLVAASSSWGEQLPKGQAESVDLSVIDSNDCLAEKEQALKEVKRLLTAITIIELTRLWVGRGRIVELTISLDEPEAAALCRELIEWELVKLGVKQLFAERLKWIGMSEEDITMSISESAAVPLCRRLIKLWMNQLLAERNIPIYFAMTIRQPITISISRLCQCKP